MPMKIGIGGVLLVMALGLTSCASFFVTRNQTFQNADASVASRDYQAAAQVLEGKKAQEFYNKQDQVLRYLDTGMLYHLADQSTVSSQRFEEAERLIEENFTKSITNAASSFLLNDTQLEYSGEAYEDIYLNVFKAINYAKLGKADDAFVEVRRVGTKLNVLEDKYGKLVTSMNQSKSSKGAVAAGKTEFHNSALAHYLGLVLYRADNSLDDARIELDGIKAAFRDQPHLYNFPTPPLDAMVNPTQKARLSVIGFAGKSPVKRATTLRIITGRNLIMVEHDKENEQGYLIPSLFLQIPFPGIAAGYNFKAQLPDMILRPSQVGKITVVVDGNAVGNLELLERLDLVALDTFGLSQNPTLYKTVFRTVVKGVSAKMAKDQLTNLTGGGLVGSLLSVATDVAVDATEVADLRSARYFPGQAYVGDFAIEPGEHTVSLQYYSRTGALLNQETFPSKNYTVKGLNLLSSCDLE